jgi:hypothetical protein
LLFRPDEYKIRFEIFKKLDSLTYPFTFGEFWRRKLALENETKSILDTGNLEPTYNKLSITLRKWRWARPYSLARLSKGLSLSLHNMQDAYAELRRYSLLEVEEIPDDLLRKVWHEMGCIKNFGKNSGGYYLVMGATKPLMFVWGQTPAFDSVVRRRMPKFGITGIAYDHWNYETWKQVLVKFKEEIEQQDGLIEFLRATTKQEYKTDKIVPYGQLIDLYYWTQPKPCNTH